MLRATGKRSSSRASPDLAELIAAADRVVTGAASGDLPEIRELDFERDGAPANAGALAVAPDLVRDLVERLARGLVGVEVGGKSVLGADRFADTIGDDTVMGMDTCLLPPSPLVSRRFRLAPLEEAGLELPVPHEIGSGFEPSAELGPIDRRRGGIIRAVVGLGKPIELLRRLEESSFTAA
jgi:hypothetical protein